MDKLIYWQRAKVVFQYIMPQLYLTQFAGWFAQQNGCSNTFRDQGFRKEIQRGHERSQKREL